MAISISTALQNAIDDPERVGAVLFTFDFGGSVYGFWTGAGELDYNGVTYQAGGSILDVSDIQQAADGSVGELTISLSTAPDKGIDDDVLIALYDETWHMQPVTIQLAFFDPDTGEIIGATTFFRGRVEEAPFEESPESSKISARCISRSIELSRGGNLYRNSATQARFDATDTSLNEIGTLNGSINKELRWGQV